MFALILYFLFWFTGVSPATATGWSRECIERFNDLTLNQDLVALVKEKEDNVLSLDLIDTNTDDDILIRKVLVDEGLAKAI